MAGRFLFRKLSSRMSRSTSLLGAYASASAATGEQVTRCAWAARYFNTLTCTNAAYGTGSPASGMPSAITLKPAFVSSVGVKRTFSSSTSTIDTVSSKPKVPTSRAEWEAKWASDKAASEADFAAWSAKQDAETAAFGRYITFFVGFWCLILWDCISMTDSESSLGDQSTYQVQRGSHCCSSCGKCQSMDRNPKTE